MAKIKAISKTEEDYEEEGWERGRQQQIPVIPTCNALLWQPNKFAKSLEVKFKLLYTNFLFCYKMAERDKS